MDLLDRLCSVMFQRKRFVETLNTNKRLTHKESYPLKQMRKTLVIIGNADLPRDFSSEIDAADFVLRFNQPRLLNGWSGTRTDCLMMCNSGKPMQQKLTDPSFRSSIFFQKAKQIVLVYHPTIMEKYFKKPNLISRCFSGRKLDWTADGVEIFGRLGKDVTIKSYQFYIDACHELDISGNQLRETFPSTGYLGIWDCLKKFDFNEWDICLCGFTWEGWKRHNWTREESWVRSKIESGMCRLL